MRKMLSLVIMVFLFIIISYKSIDAYQFAGAEYNVVENIANNDLDFGIKHRTDIGKSNLIANELDLQQVNVLEIPANKDLKVVTWANLYPSRWSLLSVRAMATNYEISNPGYKVVAAINGDFFDINAKKPLPFATEGIHISNGENYKTLDNEKGSNREPIGFINDGLTTTLVGNAKYSRSDKIVLAIYNSEDEIIKQYPIDKINSETLDNEIGIYYGKWIKNGVASVTVNNAFIIKNAQFALAYSDDDFYGKGIITNFGDDTIGVGDFAIVSHNTEVSNYLQVGVKVRAQYELTGDFANVEEATGAGRPIIYQGEFMPDETDFGKARHPRTMMGVKADGTIVMTVVDGRQDKMAGASHPEMAAILNYYGCVEAYNLDGGGSSTMLISQDGQFITTNSPSGNMERSDANCILVVAKVPIVNLTYSINQNGISIMADLSALNGYSFTDLYVGNLDDIKKIEDGKANFSNLKNNSDYLFRYYYLKDNQYIPLFLFSRIKTLKIVPNYDFINVYKAGNELNFEVQFIDPDLAIKRNSIIINGESYTIVDNLVKLNYFNGNLSNLMLEYDYDINDGIGRQNVLIENLKIRCDLDIYMNLAANKLSTAVSEIFN